MSSNDSLGTFLPKCSGFQSRLQTLLDVYPISFSLLLGSCNYSLQQSRVGGTVPLLYSNASLISVASSSVK